jgi:hypothetical protein
MGDDPPRISFRFPTSLSLDLIVDLLPLDSRGSIDYFLLATTRG